MRGEEWRARAGPWARVTLVDFQEIDIVVTSRFRTADGRWWYACQVILTGLHQDVEGRSTPVGVPTDFIVPAEDIQPIPGEDYSAVPTEGAVAGRQWLLQRLHRYPGGPAARVHRRDCWQARSGQELLTTERAIELLGNAEVEVCDVCRPDRPLVHVLRGRSGSAPDSP